MNYIMIVLIAFISVPTLSAQEVGSITVVEPAVYLESIKKENIQLVDVRTPEEFAEGHLPGAVNIDFFSEDFLEQFKALKADETIFIYCRSGNRSAKAATKLLEAGFTDIVDLKGGYKAWVKMEK